MDGTARRAAGVLTSVGVVLALLAGLLAGCSSAPAAPAPRCQRESIPVGLSAQAPAQYHVVGWLCGHGSLSGRAVEVLIPGLTYGASYWNFPVDPERYSYVRAATAAGFATLAIDRLGSAPSSTPPAADLTASSEAVALHDVVQRLHAGRVGSTRFGRVILVGHSYGSDVALREAAAYADVAGVIATGWLTVGNPPGHLQVRDSYDASASNDPKFAQASLPAGYLTTKPGTRGADFYNTGYASAAVIKEDEALKETVTTGELGSVIDRVPQASTLGIHVPVLLADGQDDNLDCSTTVSGASCASAGALIAREKANYSPRACLQAFVLPRAGHSINLHPDAPQWFAEASHWIRTHVTGPGRVTCS